MFSCVMEKGKMPRGKRPRVQVSLDDKAQAIARIRGGETKAGISRELGVPESTVRGWVKRAEQRMSTVLQNVPIKPISMPDSNAMQALCLPLKRNANGYIVPPAAPQFPLPIQIFNNAAERQLQVLGWLQVFNAGLLNFTLIASAAYLQAQERGCVEEYTLWEIISNYVNEAGQMAASKEEQDHMAATAMLPAISQPSMQESLPKHQHVKPQASHHITAEDDESF